MGYSFVLFICELSFDWFSSLEGCLEDPIVFSPVTWRTMTLGSGASSQAAMEDAQCVFVLFAGGLQQLLWKALEKWYNLGGICGIWKEKVTRD